MQPDGTKRRLSLKNWFVTRRRWQRRVVYVLGIILALFLLHTLVERLIPEVKDPRYGVSFSVKYADELGVNWQDNFTALLDDMGIRRFRLMSPWDTIEKEQGTFSFDDLDWQMDEAHKRGAKVSLAIGLRQPRWPECHQPEWYSQLGSAEAKEKALMTFLRTTVQRYRNHPALESYQLENEAVNRHFGTCTAEDIDQQRLSREFAEVKRTDAPRPIYMSLSDQHGLPLGVPVPDKYGFSVYRTVWNDRFGPIKAYVTYPTPVWYHRVRAQMIRMMHGKEVFIHELQLEPWGPEATKDLSKVEQDKSMDLAQISTNVRFARKIGTQDIDLWGGEWWYWRKTVHNDPSVWEAVKAELARD